MVKYQNYKEGTVKVIIDLPKSEPTKKSLDEDLIIKSVMAVIGLSFFTNYINKVK